MSPENYFLIGVAVMFVPVFLCGFAARDVLEAVMRHMAAKGDQQKGDA